MGHPMRPLMRIGKEGMTDAFVTEVVRSLKAHQLLKVKLDVSGRDECRERAQELAKRSEADVVDIVGSAALFYLEDPEDPLVRD